MAYQDQIMIFEKELFENVDWRDFKSLNLQEFQIRKMLESSLKGIVCHFFGVKKAKILERMNLAEICETVNLLYVKTEKQNQ